ncbi:rhodanese-like domain-containing protein [Devosia sp. 2618]|uniref:sulfurtransferase n=1 Tax=Devosia sp. 2618 TaxID=3156454 RepID=UPI0033942C1A
MTVKKLLNRSLLTAGLVALMGSAAYALPAALQSNSGSSIHIDLAQVQALATTENVVLIDIRPAEFYRAGHIPGAINIPRELIETPDVNGVIGETKSYEELEQVFADAGLSYDDRIVIYGGRDAGPLTPWSGRFAGKIYVSFDQAGFEKVNVLNEGIEAWKEPLSIQATVLEPTDFQLTRTKPQIVDKEYVLAALDREGVFVLDARGGTGYENGHIAGAHAVAWSLHNDDNTLKELDAFVARLDELGIKKDSEIITTCGWGWAAADQLAVLRDLGYTNVKLYDGSWSEWVQDENTPKAGKNFS